MTAPTDTRRVLVIDDNPAIHADFRKILATASTSGNGALDELERELFGGAASPAAVGFEIGSAFQGETALTEVARAKTAGHPYSVAFVDIRMPPGWDGIETIQRLWQVDPHLQVVICSAYSDYSWDDIQRRLGRCDGLLVLKKPFDSIEVSQLAHALTRKWALHGASVRRTEELAAAVAARTVELEAANERLRAEMAERRKIEAELRLAHKLEAIGQLAAGIAHEINTPIQYVSDNVQFLQWTFADLEKLRTAQAAELAVRGVPAELTRLETELELDVLPARVNDAFESTLEGLGRVTRIVRAMKVLAHHDNGEKRPTDLNRAIGTVLDVCRREYKLVADVETDLGELPLVWCVQDELNQVLLNLIVNAAHAIADVVGASRTRGTIRVTSRVGGDHVEVAIADTGTGIPPAIQHRVFDPFFTTKDVGRGTGQGLALARSMVVDRHGGTLTFETEPGRGTTFVVRLPIEPAKPYG